MIDSLYRHYFSKVLEGSNSNLEIQIQYNLTFGLQNIPFPHSLLSRTQMRLRAHSHKPASWQLPDHHVQRQLYIAVQPDVGTSLYNFIMTTMFPWGAKQWKGIIPDNSHKQGISFDKKKSGRELTTENRINNKQTFHSFEPIVSRSGGEWAGQLGQRRRSEQSRGAERRQEMGKWRLGCWRADTNPSQHGEILISDF